MANEDIVAAIMARLRELHPDLPERARVNLELDLLRMGRRQPLRQATGDPNLDQANLARVIDLKRHATAVSSGNTSEADSANGGSK